MGLKAQSLSPSRLTRRCSKDTPVESSPLTVAPSLTMESSLLATELTTAPLTTRSRTPGARTGVRKDMFASPSQTVPACAASNPNHLSPPPTELKEIDQS